MDQLFSKEVRPLLDLVDTLREIGIQREISLPQIAVMGDQSSGKSSVLEAISGIPFPRGSGLVTRCPTELIMSKSAAGSAWHGELSVKWSHSHQPPECGVLKSIDEVPAKLSRLADILTNDKSNGFTNDSIILRITSPDSPDLTIIDLPGIVRTSTSGQTSNVIEQVNDLITSYISLPNTIILAVVPCNQDIATVDILERASHYDKEGLRTIGVLTKPDLIGEGNEEEVEQVLLNVRKPLALGYVMVKNMSQKQSNAGMTLAQARDDEMEFFGSHPLFSKHVKKPLFGVNNLVFSLTKLLVACIKRAIPVMISDVKRLLDNAQHDLTLLGVELPRDVREQQSLLVKKISAFCQLLRHSSRGEYRDQEGVLATHTELRLHSVVQNVFKKLQDDITSLRPVTTNTNKSELFARLELEMRTQKGRELPGFINTQVFYAHIIDLVEEWRPIVDSLQQDVVSNTVRVAEAIACLLISEFPQLSLEIRTMTNRLIEEKSREVSLKIESLILREQDPFTTQDVLLEVVNGIRFRTFENILRQSLDGLDIKAIGDHKDSIREETRRRLGAWYMQRHGVDSQGNLHEMVTLIQAYWDIASRRLVDNVCMCIEMEFTGSLVRELEETCILYGISIDEETLKSLLQEDVHLTTQRAALKETVSMLTSSLAVLNRVTSDQLHNTVSV